MAPSIFFRAHNVEHRPKPHVVTGKHGAAHLGAGSVEPTAPPRRSVDVAEGKDFGVRANEGNIGTGDNPKALQVSDTVADAETPFYIPGQHSKGSSKDGFPFSPTSFSSVRRATLVSRSSSKDVASSQQAAAVDPVSRQILIRTNSGHPQSPQPIHSKSPPTLGGSAMAVATVASGEDGTRSRTLETMVPVVSNSAKDNSTHSVSQLHVYEPKDKRKVSLLSRLNVMKGKRRDVQIRDSDSQDGQVRMDGRDAQLFTVSGAAGFVPHHKAPPRYIRVRAHNKKTRDFNRMFLAQELHPVPPLIPAAGSSATSLAASASSEARVSNRQPGGSIWAIAFSLDGKFMATAGKDKMVRIWAVISTREERRVQEDIEVADKGVDERLSAPVFGVRPVRELRGHGSDVLALSWSKNNFLLSSSMDKTVKLWHLTQEQCLATFSHPDFVTSIAFHPTDDRFFLAGSLDSYLRLWNIPDKAVAYSVKLDNLITAVAFSPDGKMSIAGDLAGLCYFCDTEGLKVQSKIHVRSSRGRNAKGSKISSISTIEMPALSTDKPASAKPVLNTDRKDHDSDGAPGSLASGNVKVLVTSNDSRIRIYNLADKSLESKFKGHENICSQIAASFSDDGHYVICGSEDRRVFIWDAGSREHENMKPDENFEAHNETVTVALFVPTKTRQLLGASGDPIYDLCNPPPVTLMSLQESASVADDSHSEVTTATSVKRPEESPGYIARSTHYDGNIIVTADLTGAIKVFRQDCAAKRRAEQSDALLLNVSPALSRTVSLATRISGTYARTSNNGRSSIVVTPRGSSDHILSWRAGVNDLTYDSSPSSVLPPRQLPARSGAALNIKMPPHRMSLLHHEQPIPPFPAADTERDLVANAKAACQGVDISDTSARDESKDPQIDQHATASTLFQDSNIPTIVVGDLPSGNNDNTDPTNKMQEEEAQDVITDVSQDQEDLASSTAIPSMTAVSTIWNKLRSITPLVFRGPASINATASETGDTDHVDPYSPAPVVDGAGASAVAQDNLPLTSPQSATHSRRKSELLNLSNILGVGGDKDKDRDKDKEKGKDKDKDHGQDSKPQMHVLHPIQQHTAAAAAGAKDRRRKSSGFISFLPVKGLGGGTAVEEPSTSMVKEESAEASATNP